jgi:hypothetical protein
MRIFKIFVGIVAGLLLLGYLFVEGLIGVGILRVSHKAMAQFRGDRYEALISLVNCETCNLLERNSAVWTLGQLGDKRALPTLYKYRTGKPCNHMTSICQYDIATAIKETEGNAYVFLHVWRVVLWKDYLGPSKSHA